jgi:hypothetical protein
MSIMVSLFEVNIAPLPRDEGFEMARANSSLVLKVTDMVAACNRTSLKSMSAIDLTVVSAVKDKFGCALHVSFNDDALLHITERCIQKLFSSDMQECHRGCWCLLDGLFVRKQFGIQSDVDTEASELFLGARFEFATVSRLPRIVPVRCRWFGLSAGHPRPLL